ncbi:MAG: hypothetical protein AB1705_20165 [Verrucomicrobiota bacterium]
MSITRHKILSCVLGVLSVALVIGLLVTLGRWNRYRVDVRYAHDIVGRFNSERDLAMKGELSETVQYLGQLHFPEGQPSPFTGSLSYFVETQRRRAVHDVIVYLRAKTGEDLGDAPEAWIQKYAKK